MNSAYLKDLLPAAKRSQRRNRRLHHVGVVTRSEGLGQDITNTGGSRRSGAVRELPLPAPAAGIDSTARLYGHSPRYVPPGFLVFVRGSALYAARFDHSALRLPSVPQQVV